MKKRIMAFSLSLAMALTSASAVFAANPEIWGQDETGGTVKLGSTTPFEYTQGAIGGGSVETGGTADPDITIVTLPTAALDFTMDPQGVGAAKKALTDFEAIKSADIDKNMKTAGGAAVTTPDPTDVYTFATGVTITRAQINATGTNITFKSNFDKQDVYKQLCGIYAGEINGKSLLEFANNGKNNVKIGITIQATKDNADTNAVFLDKTTFVTTNNNNVLSADEQTARDPKNVLMLRYDPDEQGTSTKKGVVLRDSENLLSAGTGTGSAYVKTDFLTAANAPTGANPDAGYGTKGAVKYYANEAAKGAETGDVFKLNQVVYKAAVDNDAIFNTDGSKIDFVMGGDYSYAIPDATATNPTYTVGEGGFSADAEAVLRDAEAAGTTDLGTAKSGLVRTKATHLAFKISGKVNKFADWTKYVKKGTPATAEMGVGCKAVYTVSPSASVPEGGTTVAESGVAVTAGQEHLYVENLAFDPATAVSASNAKFVQADGCYKSGAAASATFTTAKAEFASADTEITFKFTGGDLTKETLSNSYFMIGNQDIWVLKSGTLKTTFNDGTNGKFDTAAGTLMIKRSFLENATYNANFAPVVDTVTGGGASKKYTVKIKDSNGKEYTAVANVED